MHRAKTLAFMTMAIGLLCLMFANIAYQNRPLQWQLQPIYTDVAARHLYAELPPHHTLETVVRLEIEYQPVKITYKEMELTYIGTYFITAYCPYECGGSWSTASGTTCHRATWNYRYTEPTTVAIDRSIHSFGDELYIAEFDRVFVAEDTGPGVQGYWIDIFYEDYDDVLNFPTGWYPVYSVSWVEKTAIVTEDELKALEYIGAVEYFAE